MSVFISAADGLSGAPASCWHGGSEEGVWSVASQGKWKAHRNSEQPKILERWRTEDKTEYTQGWWGLLHFFAFSLSVFDQSFMRSPKYQKVLE